VNWIKIGDTDKNGKYITSCKEKIKPEGEANSRRVYKGDLLLSNSMSFGRPYLLKIEGCIHDGWLALQNYKEVFDTEYLFYLLSSQIVYDQYLKKAAGSGVLNLNKKLVESIELKFPSNLNEQKAIAEILASCDKEIEQLNQKLNKLVQLKQGMMQNLLTGRIRLANPEKKYEWEEEVLPMAAEPSNEEFFASPTLDKEKEAAILTMLVGKNNLRLGRFRYQKLMYLFHRKTDNAISGWLNKAAGPYNHDLRYRGVEDMVVTKGWCTNTSQDPEHPRFEKGSNYQEAKQQFLKHYTITLMNWMKRHFLFEKDNELELLATVDKARLARARNKLSANWRGIKEYIAQEPEWEDKLKKPHFSDENLKRAVGILGRLFEYE
ncbi:MAG: restriction endonuclease subunit S, partial [Algicola sp.]|nr:restriction endonuclease subunit S [Algicola sp.]